MSSSKLRAESNSELPSIGQVAIWPECLLISSVTIRWGYGEISDSLSTAVTVTELWRGLIGILEVMILNRPVIYLAHLRDLIFKKNLRHLIFKESSLICAWRNCSSLQTLLCVCLCVCLYRYMCIYEILVWLLSALCCTLQYPVIMSWPHLIGAVLSSVAFHGVGWSCMTTLPCCGHLLFTDVVPWYIVSWWCLLLEWYHLGPAQVTVYTVYAL